MTPLDIRPETDGDAAAVHALLIDAFGGDDEALLVGRLRADGDVVLALVAVFDGIAVGHIVFSRLRLVAGETEFAAVALAPLAVATNRQHQGIGSALIEEAHRQLQEMGERLSIVLGDPAYYHRFGYSHDRAAGYVSTYQCEALQALAWSDVPGEGHLDYAPAFKEM